MDQRKKILFSAIIISFLLHLAFFWLMGYKNLLAFNTAADSESPPEEVTFVFPENRPENQPREVFQNMRENEEVPDQSNYLSDKNSRARNAERTGKTGDAPASTGNTPFANLSNPASERSFRKFTQKRFSSEALTGETTQKPKTAQEESGEQSTQSVQSEGSNQMYNQKNFSVEEVGAISLSTYRWEWAPYINAMKNKLSRVWYAPSAYYELGLIHGYTVIMYTIDRSGNLLKMDVLKHEGHPSLEKSSADAIQALFPFQPLPDDFPDETLTITAKLYYPDLRRGR
jgi:outer membrane biosynthesis protein TonB